MEINIKGNPGTGNTYVAVENGGVYNNNPNATSVTNITYNYNGNSTQYDATIDDEEKKMRKSELLKYVGKLKPLLKEEWKSKYDKLWLDILEIPEVDEKIYNKGKQRDTIFNRNLVGNIINTMKSVIFPEHITASAFAKALEGNEKHSIRAQIGNKAPKEIEELIKKLIDAANGKGN